MVIDDGWQEYRKENVPNYGPWRCGNRLFPDMPSLAAEMKKYQVRPGIWYRPLYQHDPSLKRELFLREMPDTLDPSHPEVLEQLLADSALNAFGIDYKAPASRYAELTGAEDAGVYDRVRRSLELALSSGAELDVRTTVHRRLLSEEDLSRMYEELRALGVTRWVLQQYNPVEVIDDELSALPTYSDQELIRMAGSLGSGVHVRGLTGRILNF